LVVVLLSVDVALWSLLLIGVDVGWVLGVANGPLVCW
jgi:hypothetical protein